MATPTEYFYTTTEDFDTTDCQDRDEAIGLALSKIPQDSWPTSLTLYRWRHVLISPSTLADSIVNQVVHQLDQQYRPPGQGFAMTSWTVQERFEVADAAREFLAILSERYPVEALEPVDHEEIVVADWTAQHSA